MNLSDSDPDHDQFPYQSSTPLQIYSLSPSDSLENSPRKIVNPLNQFSSTNTNNNTNHHNNNNNNNNSINININQIADSPTNPIPPITTPPLSTSPLPPLSSSSSSNPTDSIAPPTTDTFLINSSLSSQPDHTSDSERQILNRVTKSNPVEGDNENEEDDSDSENDKNGEGGAEGEDEDKTGGKEDSQLNGRSLTKRLLVGSTKNLNDDSAEPLSPSSSAAPTCFSSLSAFFSIFFSYLYSFRLFITFQLVLDPQLRNKVLWDWMIIFMVLYNAFVIPWYIAYDVNLAVALDWFDTLTTVCMAMDIFVTSRTGFIDFSGNTVYENKAIVKRYWNRGLLLDLIGTFPFQVFSPLFSFGSQQFVSNVFKAPNLLRACRLLYNDQITQLNTPLARIAKLLFGFFYLAHLFGSLFFFVGTVQATNTSWILEADLIGATYTEQYIASLYWALTTMVTVGYGDIHATTVYEQAVVIPILMLSALIYATIFGNVAYAVETLSSTIRRYQNRMDMIKEFIKVYELPIDLQQKLFDYTNAMWNQNKGFETEEMLSHLPTSVKAEIMMHINESLIERVPLLKQCSDRFLEAIILRMSTQVCLAGDFIFKQGDKSREMYFVRSGTVEIIMEDPVTEMEQVIATIYDFSESPFFGEISLLLGETRTASAKAIDKCVLSSLSQHDFFEVLSMFPDEENSLRETAAMRLQDDIDREQQSMEKRTKSTKESRKTKTITVKTTTTTTTTGSRSTK